MPRKPRMIYVPLDVEFPDNEKILRAGERAGWLYVAMLCRTKRLVTDGVLSTLQVERLQISGWKQRLAQLVEVGLVKPTDDGRWLVVGWLERNPSAKQLAEYRRKDSARKRPDSERIPDGIPPDSGAEVEENGEEKRLDVEETTYEAAYRAELAEAARTSLRVVQRYDEEERTA